MTVMPWVISHRFDPPAVRLADRHYNRRKVGSPQFVPPGRNLVLLTPEADAVWVTSWPFAEYVRHEWPGAWVNSVFRREGGPQASELIRAAVAASLWHFGAAPDLGIVTFIDTKKNPPQARPQTLLPAGGLDRSRMDEGWPALPRPVPSQHARSAGADGHNRRPIHGDHGGDGMTDLSEGDEVLVRGMVNSRGDRGVTGLTLANGAMTTCQTGPFHVVPLALVRALVRDVIAVGALYDAPGAWDAKENAARILAAKARTLLTAAPWLGEA